MSTSLLYHLFKVRGYNYIATKYEGTEVNFQVSPKPEMLCCPNCLSYNVKRRGTYPRKIRLASAGIKPSHVLIKVPRVECRVCGVVRLIKLGIADAKRSYTKAFERMVLDLSKRMTILDVAQYFEIGWDVAKDIVKRNLTKRFSKPKLKHLRRLAIDEISVAKGHKYLTVVLDLDSGTIVFVGDGKGADALIPFWKRLQKAHAKIEAISTDMSSAYISAVLGSCSKAVLVFDHFHVVKLMNERLSEVRRLLFHEMKDALEKKIMKGSRWLLLKNPENLDDERNEKQRLQDILELNKPLSIAYYMKEDLRQIWDQTDKETAKKVLDGWVEIALASKVGPLIKMGQTLAKYSFGILNWYTHQISSGPLEGINNKIKTLKRQAYGYRDLEFFKLRIMAIHEAKYAFTG